MTNKDFINKLKDYAELAQAAYGYYHLITNSTNQSYMILKNEKDKDKATEEPVTKEIGLTDIVDSTYYGYDIYAPPLPSVPNLKPEKIGTFKGDFTKTQTERFFKKYEVLIHQPNTSSRFSATLFKDTQAEDKNQQYILAFRGTESTKEIA